MSKFVKGQSGNPAGRPKGARGRYTAFRERVEDSLEDLVNVLIEKALEGDMAAMRLLLERSVPKLLPETGRELIDLPPINIMVVGEEESGG